MYTKKKRRPRISSQLPVERQEEIVESPDVFESPMEDNSDVIESPIEDNSDVFESPIEDNSDSPKKQSDSNLFQNMGIEF